MPIIYFTGQDKVKSNEYKKIGEVTLDKKALEKIYLSNFNASIRIFFETLKPNFYECDRELKDKYSTLNQMHKIRNIKVNGTQNTLDEQLDQYKVTHLYKKKDNFDLIKKAASWFVEESYKRIQKITSN